MPYPYPSILLHLTDADYKSGFVCDPIGLETQTPGYQNKFALNLFLLYIPIIS
jgi:hypothetical protein